ncbi:MAG: hypothetical protein KF861_20230 [Planctomycetaceae bacterium]|nr:hypothetical protein [Planctomycetaceae bacterium]
MPAVADLPPKPAMNYLYSEAEAFGNEGEFVSKRAKHAAEHWEDRTECLLSQSLESDEFDYQIVPLVKVGAIRVRYHFIGQIQPLPYEWDD